VTSFSSTIDLVGYIATFADAFCTEIDAPCLCKAKTFVNAAQIGLGKACKEPSDAQLYLNFINAQCSGQSGYPITLKQTCKMISLSLVPACDLSAAERR
jgi:hypothetical protein